MAANIKPIFPDTPHVETGTGTVTFTGTTDGSRVDTVVLFNSGGGSNTQVIDIRYGTTILRRITVGALAANAYTEEIMDKAIPNSGTINVTTADANIHISIFGGHY